MNPAFPTRSVVEFTGFQGFEGVDMTRLVCTRKSFKFFFSSGPRQVVGAISS